VLKDLPPRKARNPRTGETIEIAARKRVSFRVAPSLRKTLLSTAQP
jgi:nucleoid DNA-binding protein